MIRFTNVIQGVMGSPIKGFVKEKLGMLLTELTYFRAADHPTDCRVRSEYGQLSGTVFKKPAGIVDYSSYSWVLDTTRAKNKLGWKPRYTSRETLRIMLETHDYNLL